MIGGRVTPVERSQGLWRWLLSWGRPSVTGQTPNRNTRAGSFLDIVEQITQNWTILAKRFRVLSPRSATDRWREPPVSTLLQYAGRSSRTAGGTVKALLLILFLPAWIAGHPAVATTTPAVPGVDPTLVVGPPPPPTPGYPPPTFNGVLLSGFGDSSQPTFDGLPFTVASDYPEPTYNGLPLSMLGSL
jgi:hypothetical protein